MNLATYKSGEVLVVRILDSRFGADAVESFNAQVLPFIEAGNPPILLDLADVSFLDSSGLGAIVGCVKAQNRPGCLAVCGARETVKTLFKLTHMSKVFRFFPTREEGVAALS